MGKTAKIKSKRGAGIKYLAIAVFIFLLAIRIYPAAINDYPKGSDTWYHMERSRSILAGDLFYDSRNAGGTASSYPPVFHIAIAPIFLFGDPLLAARLLTPILGFIAVLAFFLFARKLAGEKAALAAAFVFGISVEIVNTAIFLAPQNLGFIFMFLALYFLLDSRKIPFAIFGILLALTHALSFLVFILLFLAIAKKSQHRLILPAAVSFILWIAAAKIAGASAAIILRSPLTIEQIAIGMSPLLIALAVLGMEKKTKKISLVFVALISYSLIAGMYPDRIFTFAIIPGSLLAGMGFAKFWPVFSEEKFVRAAMIAVLIAASLFVFDYGYARAEMTHEDKSALSWIKRNAEPNATVAAHWQTSGPWVPFLAERRNILGSFQESVSDHQERRKDLDIIFSSTDKATIIKMMNKYNATYIYANEMEDTLSPDALKRLSSMFIEVFGNNYAHIFSL